jgi:hypothetical protein
MKDDIIKILPDHASPHFEKTKKESPYSVLSTFAQAINEKYQNKITARVTETFRNLGTDSTVGYDNPLYSFYLHAPIGTGYLYRLLEIQQTTKELYPIHLKVFQNQTRDAGNFTNYTDFYSEMTKIFSTGFVSIIILNLIGQVELYKEMRKSEGEDDF